MPQDPLKLWTVYDRPRDFPNSHVARLWLATAPEPTRTDTVVIGSLKDIQVQMRVWGLCCVGRDPNDDPCIVETWL